MVSESEATVEINISEKAREIMEKSKIKVKPIHRVILTTDGSVTRVIEAYTNRKVEIKTEIQRIIKAGRTIANILDVKEDDMVNLRVVDILSNNKLYAKALSLSPVKRLSPEFREDLMKADIPIGRIIRSHKLEVRREIAWMKICSSDEVHLKFNGDLNLFKDKSVVMVRNYNIIHKNSVLMNITEFFPLTAFD
jgi:chorismate-pyruvate lyase